MDTEGLINMITSDLVCNNTGQRADRKIDAGPVVDGFDDSAKEC